MKFIALISLLFILLLSGCGKGSDPTRSPDGFVPVTSIRIVAVSSKIAAKTSTRLTVLGNHSGIYESDLTSQAVLVSDTTTVADFVTVSQPDRISGILPGNVVITATVAGLTATLPLTVSTAKISTLTVSTLTPSVASGLTSQFKAQGNFDDSTVQDVTFDATWTATAGTGNASISNDPASRGLAKGLAVGTATITAAFDTVSNSAQLTVLDPILQSMAVAPAGSSVDFFLATVPFTATGTFSDGSTKDITTSVIWSSSQTTVATIVVNTGVATPTGAGTTTINVVSGNISGKTDLTVNTFSLSSPTPSVTIKTTSPDNTIKLKVDAKSSVTGIQQDVTDKCTWSHDPTNTLIATVSDIIPNKGLVIAGTLTGSTTVTATCGGVPLVFTITVTL
ncbi:MAG: Ig-like domain-containing protein [Geobacteraceae bacterium]|nr:Ig-like domain-containing protein [Geobacteraceae bacterium]